MDENATSVFFVGNESVDDNCSLYNTSMTKRSKLFEVAQILDSLIPPIIMIIGIPGNILTMIVIIRQYKVLSSTAVYLLMLAISDTVFILFGTFVDWFSVVFQFKIREQNNISCKICIFMYYASAQFSSWVLVAITIERIICVTVPHKVKILCTPKLSFICGTITCICIVCINTHFLFGYGISDTFLEYYESVCGPLYQETYQVFHFDIWPWVDFSLLFALPFVVISFGNSVILIKLSKHNSTNNIKQHNDTYKSRNQRRYRSVTRLILGLNFTFLFCVTPLAVFFIIEPIMFDWIASVACIDPITHDYRQGLFALFWSISISLSYVNPSVNFILYVLSGEKFRNEIKALILCTSVSAENTFA